MTDANQDTQPAPLVADEQTRYDQYVSGLWDKVKAMMAQYESPNRFDHDYNREVSTMRGLAPDGDLDLVNAAADVIRKRVLCILTAMEAEADDIARAIDDLPNKMIDFDPSLA